MDAWTFRLRPVLPETPPVVTPKPKGKAPDAWSTPEEVQAYKAEEERLRKEAQANAPKPPVIAPDYTLDIAIVLAEEIKKPGFYMGSGAPKVGSFVFEGVLRDGEKPIAFAVVKTFSHWFYSVEVVPTTSTSLRTGISRETTSNVRTLDPDYLGTFRKGALLMLREWFATPERRQAIAKEIGVNLRNGVNMNFEFPNTKTELYSNTLPFLKVEKLIVTNESIQAYWTGKIAGDYFLDLFTSGYDLVAARYPNMQAGIFVGTTDLLAPSSAPPAKN